VAALSNARGLTLHNGEHPLFSIFNSLFSVEILRKSRKECIKFIAESFSNKTILTGYFSFYRIFVSDIVNNDNANSRLSRY